MSDQPEISPGDRALMQAIKALWEEEWPERELVAYGVEDGIPWVIGPGGHYGLCGYAIVPAEGHPWSKGWPNGIDQEKHLVISKENLAKVQAELDSGATAFQAMETVYGDNDEPLNRDYLDDYLSCHGGITWYQHPFVGFDTMHSGDVWDGTPWEEPPMPGMSMRSTDIARKSPWVTQWSLEKICEEAKNLARQVAEVRNLQQAFDLDVAVADGKTD